MSRNAFQIFQAEDPQGYAVLQVAAEMSRSEHVPPMHRAILLIEISEAVAPYLIKAAAESVTESIEEAKTPKYEWRRGARVRVN